MKAPAYSATIKVYGKTFRATGKSVYEALENLKHAPIKAMSVVTVKKGKLSKDRVLPPVATYRLFSPSRLMREVALKNTSLLFDL